MGPENLIFEQLVRPQTVRIDNVHVVQKAACGRSKLGAVDHDRDTHFILKHTDFAYAPGYKGSVRPWVYF